MGSRKGCPNRITKDMRERALHHADKALKRLIRLLDSENETVALAAAREVLDRAYGKPRQAVQHSGAPEGPPIEHKIVHALPRSI